MGLLASAAYDPSTAVTKSTTSLLAMTAVDTTNLRLAFTVPANGAVLVRLRCPFHGSATWGSHFLGVLESSTVRLRMTPIGSLTATSLATSQLTQEVLAVVPGLTPGAAATWDAAYSVDVVSGAGGFKYGGPNDNVGADAWGAFLFEVWDAPNLLAAKLYDPTGGAVVSKATSALLAMTALDTTNLRCSFTATTTKALVRLRGCYTGATTSPQVLLGVLDGATVQARTAPIGGIVGPNAPLATTRIALEGSAVVTGLTVGTAYNWDAAYAVQVVLASTNIVYGGPNNTTTNDAGGAFGFEVWAV